MSKNRKPAKTDVVVTPERVVVERRSRFNLLRGLTPESLSRQLDSYSVGYIRDFAITAEKIEERDDVLKTVASKRKKAIARREWEILTVENTPEAEAHKEALEYFYNHLSVTNSTDENISGGIELLIRQMMDAIGKGYAVHEIVWQPKPSGLTAQFRFVPLWFFENTTGKLRYLPSNSEINGVPLEEGGWLTTATDPLMPASAVAWMYKNLSLKDWVTYCERHGMPGIRGVTSAARGSTEWNEMVEAVQNFAAEFAAVMSDSDRIEAIDLKGTGQLPYKELVERMDRAIAALWRGADLGTISKGEGLGASLQGDEGDLLEQDDAQLIAGTLNSGVGRYVIRYLFGEEAEPQAYLKILIPQPQNVQQDILVDEFLTKHGVRVGIKGTLERYKRPMAEEGEEVLTASAPPPQEQPGITSQPIIDQLSNEDQATSLQEISKATLEDLKPVLERLLAILEIQDEGIRTAKLQAFRDEYPQLAKSVLADPAAAGLMAREMEQGFLQGLQKGAKETKESRNMGAEA